jgi:hypothetical protein
MIGFGAAQPLPLSIRLASLLLPVCPLRVAKEEKVMGWSGFSARVKHVLPRAKMNCLSSCLGRGQRRRAGQENALPMGLKAAHQSLSPFSK